MDASKVYSGEEITVNVSEVDGAPADDKSAKLTLDKIITVEFCQVLKSKRGQKLRLQNLK